MITAQFFVPQQAVAQPIKLERTRKMKFKVVFLIAVLICCLAIVPAEAKGKIVKAKASTADTTKGYSVSLGFFSSTDKENDVGTGKCLTLSYDLPQQFKTYRLQASVSFVRMTGSYEETSLSEKVMPITIRAIRDFKPTQSYKPYAGVGVGIMKMDLSASADGESESMSNTTYCYELLGGADFKESYYAEFRVLGSPDSDTALNLNIGRRF